MVVQEKSTAILMLCNFIEQVRTGKFEFRPKNFENTKFVELCSECKSTNIFPSCFRKPRSAQNIFQHKKDHRSFSKAMLAFS